MEDYTLRKRIQTVIFIGSVILLVQTVLVATRVNGNYDAHWALVLFPSFFLLGVWLFYLLWTSYHYWLADGGHTHSPMILTFLWNGFVWFTVFMALFSVEQSEPGKIGILATASPLIVLFGLNVLVYLGFDPVMAFLHDSSGTLASAEFHLNYDSRAPFPSSDGLTTTGQRPYTEEYADDDGGANL